MTDDGTDEIDALLDRVQLPPPPDPGPKRKVPREPTPEELAEIAAFEEQRAQILATAKRLWWAFLALTIAATVILPLETGWQSIGTIFGLILSCAWARFWLWFAPYLRKGTASPGPQ